MTIKGTRSGASRAEYEYEIPVEDADEILDNQALGAVVEKTRYRVDHAGLTWEVDVFEGANAGLAIAEVELPSETADVQMPEWVGDEVTDDDRYYNSNLVAHPYSTW